MDLELNLGLMEINMRDNTPKVKRMERVSILGTMEAISKETG